MLGGSEVHYRQSYAIWTTVHNTKPEYVDDMILKHNSVAYGGRRTSRRRAERNGRDSGGSGQADGGGRLACGRLRAGRRLRAGGQGIAHRPCRVAVRKSRDRFCVIFVSFVLTNLVVLLNLKNRWGEGQPHVGNNGVAGRYVGPVRGFCDYVCCGSSQPLTIRFCSPVP